MVNYEVFGGRFIVTFRSLFVLIDLTTQNSTFVILNTFPNHLFKKIVLCHNICGTFDDPKIYAGSGTPASPFKNCFMLPFH